LFSREVIGSEKGTHSFKQGGICSNNFPPPFCSPNLSPNDVHLFWQLRELKGGLQFEKDEDFSAYPQFPKETATHFGASRFTKLVERCK
jgi:hypothetical protein